ncbi:hypothetical protein FOL47_001138 [Perkinsus chesapeaki]|uniref:Uncharacterized protein n=1 Tax=Perkinsus chesapeaki TaxID=330153 RepID=A0A7J6KSZ1_PERCH|nr:hypothetical protein FOL47_001138 [Perkinsus chesapeaki]
MSFIIVLLILITDAVKVEDIKGDKKGCVVKAKPLEAQFSWEEGDLILKSLICPSGDSSVTDDKKGKKKKNKKVAAKDALKMDVSVKEQYEVYKPDSKTIEKGKTDSAKCKAAVGELGKATVPKKKGLAKLIKSGNDEMIKYLCDNKGSHQEVGDNGDDDDKEEDE